MTPTLYKKTSTGAIQYWTISVVDTVIRTEYGQVGTENPQVTEDTIHKGKNVGRANETSAREQAQAEAQAKWVKQLKKGYVKTLAEAQAGTTDIIIQGGVLPMLAHKFKEHGHKIKYPALGQPKLDGMRCVAVKKDGHVTLWSRERKPIVSMPHVVAALERLDVKDIILDGELYNHEYQNDFEEILSLIRPAKPVDGHEAVQYHIYDVICSQVNSQRVAYLRELVPEDEHSLQLVHTQDIPDAASVVPFFEKMLELGYEGAMIRNAAGLYVHKRSYDLLKYKEMQDGEYKIIDFEQGRGRLQGHVGKFWCVTPDGKRFKAKMKGKTSKLREYFVNHKLWKDKVLTVQFQNFTADGVPRFPVGKAIRDYE